MRKRLILLLVVLLLGLTACKTTGTFSDANNYLAREEYDKAIEVFNYLLESDQEDVLIWFGLVESYMATEAYDEADQALEHLYHVLIDQFTSLDEASYTQYINQLQDYTDLLIIKTGHIGRWFHEVQPEPINLNDYDFGSFRTGETITFTQADDTSVYYAFNDKSPTVESLLYEDFVMLTETGNHTLSTLVVSKYGIRSEISTAHFDVRPGVMPPTLNYDSGTYTGPITLYFDDYAHEEDEVYFTINGDDPRTGDLYPYGSGKLLRAGTYIIQAVTYSHSLNIYSTPVSIELKVTASEGHAVDAGPVTMRIVSFDMPDTIDEQVKVIAKAVDDDYENIKTTVIDLDNLDALINMFKGESPPDLVYTNASYAIDLYNYIGNIGNIVPLEDADYYTGTLETGFYWDALYTLPVVAKPEALLYQLSTDVNADLSYTQLVAGGNLSLYGAIDYDDLLALYHGNGGVVVNELGYIKLNQTALTNSYADLKQMVTDGLIDPSDNENSWVNSRSSGIKDYMILASEDMLPESGTVYTPAGMMPKPNGFYALYPMTVYGLMAGNRNMDDPGSPHSNATQIIYDYFALQPRFNYVLSNNTGGLPAFRRIYNTDLYKTYMPYETLDTLLSITPGDSQDLRQLMEDYVDHTSIINQLLDGLITPVEAAKQTIDAIEKAYLP